MEKIAKEILHCIEKFNTFLNNQILSQSEIQEEKDNLKDFFKAKKKLIKIIKIIEKSPIDDLKKNSKNLINLHLELCNITWYFQNLHENVKKIIKLYPYQE